MIALLFFSLTALFLMVDNLVLQLLSTSFGSKFLLALPRLMESSSINITFILYTPLSRPVSVVFSVPNHASDIEQTLLLRQGSLTRVKPHSIFSQSGDIGHKHTFAFNGNGSFGISIHMTDGLHYSETLTVLPVSGWGRKYMAVTLRKNPSIVIINSVNNNEIEIKIKESVPDVIKDLYRTSESMYTLYLKEYESYSISQCDGLVGSLTGTIIEARKSIGVISGSCLSDTVVLKCHSAQLVGENGTHDIAMEMLLPHETYGREFIAFSITGRQSHGLIMVIGWENFTHIEILLDDKGAKSLVILTKSGDWAYLITSNQNYFFKSDKPVQAAYIQRSQCWSNMSDNTFEYGGPALALIIPMELFYDHYIWNSPGGSGIQYVHHITVVIQLNNIQHLKLDGMALPIFNWHSVIGRTDWRVGNLDVRKGLHNVYSVRTARFVCYVYGIANTSSYMHNAGYIASPINAPCILSVPFMRPGDLIDNDCDSYVDEEVHDAIDNDNDGIVDEDLGNPSKECLPGFWGADCSKTCPNCGPHCDRLTGACYSCKLGFKKPETGCKFECGPYEFGKECLGNCKRKCGTDCTERRHGTCPINKDDPVTWVILMALISFSVPVCLLCSLLMTKRKADNEFADSDFYPDEFSVRSETNFSSFEKSSFDSAIK